MHLYKYMHEGEGGREFALIEKAKICSLIHQAWMTDTDKTSCQVKSKDFLLPRSLCNFKVL